MILTKCINNLLYLYSMWCQNNEIMNNKIMTNIIRTVQCEMQYFQFYFIQILKNTVNCLMLDLGPLSDGNQLFLKSFSTAIEVALF